MRSLTSIPEQKVHNKNCDENEKISTKCNKK